MISKKVKKINTLLDSVEVNIPHCNTINQKISASNVGWHLEHILLTIDVIITTLSKSNPNDYKWKFNFMRIIVLTIKKFPRGRAKSPEIVKPKGNINDESLANHLVKTRERIKELQTLNKNNFFKHPIFGELNLKQTIRFLEVHTQHHLNIINDIIH